MANHEFTVTVGNNARNLKIIKINTEIRKESQKYYAKALSEAIDNEFPLRIEIERMLQKKNILDTSEDEQFSEEVRKKIKDAEIELRQGVKDGRKMTKLEGRVLALSIRNLRGQLREIGSSVSNFMSNTAESYANNEQMQYFLYACTVDASTGQRYWPTFESFKNDTDSPAYAEAAKEFLSMMTGIDKDYERNLYEIKWLLKMGYINNELQFVDANGRLTDEDGKLIDKDGRYINEQGEFVDSFNNPIDKDGNLLIKDSWDEPTPVPALAKV